jgi:GH24 family phage-related lysozyme (muramidase)
MKASEKCLELIRRFEGFRSKAYRCPAGVWTIGYGSTRYADGTRVHQSDPPITEAQADEIMRATLGEYERAVDRYVSVFVNQNEFDALIAWSFNVGSHAMANSTLVKKLNGKEAKTRVADELLRWDKVQGKPLAGLTRRRKAERAMFLGEA